MHFKCDFFFCYGNQHLSRDVTIVFVCHSSGGSDSLPLTQTFFFESNLGLTRDSVEGASARASAPFGRLFFNDTRKVAQEEKFDGLVETPTNFEFRLLNGAQYHRR